MILRWDSDKTHEDPVSVAKDLRMPQFEMQKITTNRCHETNHMGKKEMQKEMITYLSYFLFNIYMH